MSSYMISRAGEQFGPYSEADLRGYIGSGQVLPDDLAWTEGMADWLPVSQIFPAGVKNPVAPPPPAYVKPSGGDVFPDGIKGWSWGAFLLSGFWAIGNRTWIGLLAFVPYAGLIMAIILGIKGREWAWKNKEWESVEHFNRVQRKWSIWGVVVLSASFVVGLLAAIALPAYQDYSIRSKVGEVLMVGGQAKVAVAEFIFTENAIPTRIEQTGFSPNSPYVKRVAVNGQTGAILLTIGFSPLTDKTIALVPSRDQDGSIAWKCVSEDVPPKYLPAVCRQ